MSLKWKSLPIVVMSQRNMDLLSYQSASLLVLPWNCFENEILVTVLHNFFNTSYL